MLKIQKARELVTKIQQQCPEGLRKTLRAELANNAKNANSPVKAYYKSKSQFQSACSNVPLENFMENIEAPPFAIINMKRYYAKDAIYDYCSKVFDKETDSLCNKLFKEFGVKINNETSKRFSPESKILVLTGLEIAKNANLKLPKKIFLRTYKDGRAGHFNILRPDRIYINVDCNNLIGTTVHEILHKNDIKAYLKRYFSFYKNDQFKKHKELIKNEIRDYAATDSNEFVTNTAEKLLVERKSWSNFNPIIKELYEKYNGLKLNFKG